MSNLQRYFNFSPNAAKDEIQWLLLFPKEIWAYLLDWTRDPEALYSVSQASRLFENLLESKKTLYLFPQVLEILLNKKHFLDEDDLLTCRLVCSSWKSSINRILDTRPYHHLLSYKTGSLESFEHLQKINGPHNDPALAMAIHLDSNAIADILEIMMDVDSQTQKNQNPFPSRQVALIEKIPYDALEDGPNITQIMERYRFTIKTFLEIVGHNFWHCQLLSIKFTLTPVTWYKWIHSLLESMPNLRTLSLDCPSASRACTFPQKLTKFTPAEFAELDEQVDKNPFPIFGNLQKLVIENFPQSLLNSTLKSAPKTLKVLQIRREEVVAEMKTKQYEMLGNEGPHTLEISIQNESELVAIPKTWKLQSLKLDFQNCRVKWSTVFEKLNLYKDTLVQLDLWLPKVKRERNKILILKESSNFTLNLPKVKKLKLTVSNMCSFDFLQNFQGLEYLHLILDHMDYKYFPTNDFEFDAFREKIRIHELYRNLMDSNIWERLPALQKVDLALQDENFGFLVYLRHTYRRGKEPIFHYFFK